MALTIEDHPEHDLVVVPVLVVLDADRRLVGHVLRALLHEIRLLPLVMKTLNEAP
jgi:hypothetical protein